MNPLFSFVAHRADPLLPARDAARHVWTPASLARDLIPPVAYNARLGSGELVRVFPFGGRWHATRESGASLVWWTIDEACGWLGENNARPLGVGPA